MKRLITTMLLVACSAGVAAKEMYIPIAGYAEGANGTFFRTDVRIFNPESRAIQISLHFLPAGVDGRNIPGRIVDLEPREMLVLDNIVAEFFELSSPILGAIWLDSWHGDVDFQFTADSRTFTNSPETGIGTYGQFIPARAKSDARKDLVVLHLSNSLAGNTGFRSNAGVMNPGFEPATVTTSLYHADGTLAGTNPGWILPANTVIQQSVAQMAGLSSVELTDGYLVVESSQPVFAYGSVVDNITADQFFVTATEEITIGGDLVVTPDCENPAPLHLSDFPVEGWIVVFNEGINGLDEASRLSAEYEFIPSYTYSGGGFEGFAADLTAETIAKLRCEPSVKYIQQNARGNI